MAIRKSVCHTRDVGYIAKYISYRTKHVGFLHGFRGQASHEVRHRASEQTPLRSLRIKYWYTNIRMLLLTSLI